MRWEVKRFPFQFLGVVPIFLYIKNELKFNVKKLFTITPSNFPEKFWLAQIIPNIEMAIPNSELS